MNIQTSEVIKSQFDLLGMKLYFVLCSLQHERLFEHMNVHIGVIQFLVQ
jgi:hypothetical protein